MIKVLYDGWSLVRQPNSPAALHLYTLLRQRHADVEALAALPDQPPEWLPKGAIPHVLPSPSTIRDRLIWEQRSLPHLAKSLGAHLLHLTTSNPPLFGAPIAVVSPTEFPSSNPPAGFTSRLRLAMASGGMARMRGFFLPADLAGIYPSEIKSPLFLLPVEPFPSTSHNHPRGIPQIEALDLPDTYILYHGPHRVNALRRLLIAWSWAARSIGRDCPLLIIGLDTENPQDLQRLLTETDLVDTVRPLPTLHPELIPFLYQNCSAVFHPAPMAPWGNGARLALAYGKPLVAADNDVSDALAGAGAYLAPQNDPRALGAALISVIVEEQLAQNLAQAGQQHAARWNPDAFQEELYAAYLAILSKD
jgi:Glycosyl transferases group 1